jgi:hypothetical protein
MGGDDAADAAVDDDDDDCDGMDAACVAMMTE